MNQQASVLRTGRKFDQVLAGAREVFLADGFEGASVDNIAKAAGVSKATLYSYFPDKRVLFMEVVRSVCVQQSEASLDLAAGSCGPREVLRVAAEHVHAVLIGGLSLQLFRIFVAEADRFPELGPMFYESGPMVLHGQIRDYLKIAAERGELAIPDADLAAAQFIELCKADIFLRFLFNIDEHFTEAERERVIAGAIETFMARFGT
ncbi:TetR/AcrR family transcriptional regulator [Leisingera sp. M527]|uniref:TetR/AcrR family transcriptional regulator n=2 Tax=Leisingera TaxID=191028 RepID=UPI000B21E53D|nr:MULTISPECIES: TetR/AcrR family transcriptional regulator [unclassified Leisingera]UWQ29014.1 TetR/AcrR family transcriptional regulator [Leisingera sp. M523]UWQ32555.1 TetR/AcrR family transcriptional regulator [Leisingera sp. M527]UWQ74515.1 TetR/AcrR family transcriptional regulator [Leisingera sp. M658]